MKYLLLVATLFASASWAGNVDDFHKELDALCNKTKQCAVAQMPPEMRGMADAMMGGMCTAYDQAFAAARNPEFSDIYEAARSCVRSMTALSCENLMDDPETAECQEYQKVAEGFAEKYEQ